MASLSYLPIGIPSGRLVFRPIWPQVVVAVTVDTHDGGKHARRLRALQEKRFKDERERLQARKEALRAAFAALEPGAKADVAEELSGRPVVARRIPKVDWQAVAADAERFDAAIRLFERVIRRLDLDDDERDIEDLIALGAL